MYLKKITLHNFRNYHHAEIIFDPYLNILVGDNAQGKTNILEAIYYLSGGRSHRTWQERELIHWDKDKFILSAIIETKKGSARLQIIKSISGKKNIKINGINNPKNREEFKVVIFSPDDLNLVKGSPSQRRNFLDIETSQVFPLYNYNLINYYKVLRHRNKVLKLRLDNKNTNSSLKVWEDQLVKYGSFILKKRLEVIKYISDLVHSIHCSLTDNKENLLIEYDSELKIELDNNIQEIKDIYHKKLEQKREEEIRYGVTLLGPHRDDLKIFINKQPTRNYASQGQQRTCVLSLKLSIMKLIKEKFGEYPILLLDDVFSELDSTRKNFLVKEIFKENVQTFITSTRQENLIQELRHPAKIFFVKEGECNPFTNGKNKQNTG